MLQIFNNIDFISFYFSQIEKEIIHFLGRVSSEKLKKCRITALWRYCILLTPCDLYGNNYYNKTKLLCRFYFRSSGIESVLNINSTIWSFLFACLSVWNTLWNTDLLTDSIVRRDKQHEFSVVAWRHPRHKYFVSCMIINILHSRTTSLTGFCTRVLRELLLRRITERIQDCALLTTKYSLISTCLFIPYIRKLTGAFKSVTFLPQ